MPATPGTTAWPPKLAVGAHFARHARNLGRENAELLNHRVHDIRRTQEFAFEWPPIHVESHGLRQVSLCHGANRAGDFSRGAQQVLDQRIHGKFHLAPSAARLMKPSAFPRLAFLADHLAHAPQFLGHLLVGGNDLVEGVGDLSGQSRPRAREPHGKISVAHRVQRSKNHG